MSGNTLFGDWGRGPRASDPDVQYAPTPVGVPCMKCEEAIRPGDVGEFMPYYGMGVSEVLPIHRECLMLGVIGHIYGVCSCTDYAGTNSTREAALVLAQRVDSSIPEDILADADFKNAYMRDGGNGHPPYDADGFS